MNCDNTGNPGMNTLSTPKNQQHGAILVISLLILLVLTLIGVSSLDGSVMEEKMAANSQTATRIFQKAESSIQEAFVTAQFNPPGAVAAAIANVSNNTVDHSSSDIHSTSMLHDPPGSNVTPLLNSSADLFIARRMEIVGSADVGNIHSNNTHGYRVFPLMNVNQ